jgi:hypothetical protein
MTPEIRSFLEVNHHVLETGGVWALLLGPALLTGFLFDRAVSAVEVVTQ